MNTSAIAMLAEAKMKRGLREDKAVFPTYWKTYAQMALYAILFVADYEWKIHLPAMIYGLAIFAVIARATPDTQSESNRRFSALMEILEKKNVL